MDNSNFTKFGIKICLVTDLRELPLCSLGCSTNAFVFNFVSQSVIHPFYPNLQNIITPVRARDLRFWDNIHLQQHATYHGLHVMCHVSCVTCNVSHVTCHVSSQSPKHHNFQTVIATGLKFWDNIQLPQCITCHVSCVMGHMSHVMCHVSHVTCHMSQKIHCIFFFLQIGWVSRRRVSYQLGLPRLVYQTIYTKLYQVR